MNDRINRCDPTFWKNNDTGHARHLLLSHGVSMDSLRKLPIDKMDAFHVAILEQSGLDTCLNAGYCIDEWFLWQQGWCGTYAMALMSVRPSLRLGVAGYLDVDGWRPAHFFAHDDDYAYDSAGRHPLPYTGVNQDFDHVELDTDPEAWGSPFMEEGTSYVNVVEAVRHSVRNGILIGWYQRLDVGMSGSSAA